VREKLF
jgi:hypothetical protein